MEREPNYHCQQKDTFLILSDWSDNYNMFRHFSICSSKDLRL